MKLIDLAKFRPISRSLDCANALVDQSCLDVETDFALDVTAVRSGRSWAHHITSVSGFRTKGCLKAYDWTTRLHFSILLGGKISGCYLADWDGYLIPVDASFEVRMRGVFTMDREGSPIDLKGYAECIFSKVEWGGSSGGSISLRETPLSAGCYFQNQAVDRPPPLYLDVFALQEQEHIS